MQSYPLKDRRRAVTQRLQHTLATAFAMAVFAPIASADLPTQAVPSRGGSDGNYIELMQNFQSKIKYPTKKEIIYKFVHLNI